MYYCACVTKSCNQIENIWTKQPSWFGTFRSKHLPYYAIQNVLGEEHTSLKKILPFKFIISYLDATNYLKDQKYEVLIKC